MRRESVFVVTANVAPGVNAGLVADTIQDVVDGLARDVAPTEIDRARRSWRNATHAQMETTWGRADSLVSLADAGLEPGAGFDWGYGRYESIGEADIKNAAAKWLALTHRVGVVVLMEKGAPRRGSLVIRQEVGE